MKTAEELLQKVEKQYTDLSGTKVVISEKGARRQLVTDAMKEYAWIKVQEALQAASENAETDYELGNPYDPNSAYPVVKKNSILNAYPKSNIV